ncbi:MAG: ATPase domain-containing protein [Candidatus Micrarchaeia archaeon]
MVTKIPTGISGLDRMLNGGIPMGNQVILEGGPGSGKTLLALEFLYHGAEHGENGILFSFEEDFESIIENFKEAFPTFTNFDAYIKNGAITILGSEDTKQYVQKNKEGTAYSFGSFISEIDSVTKMHNAKRIVIDSISVIRLFISDPLDYRSLSTSLLSVLKRQKITTILISEQNSSDKQKIYFQPESFIYDGLILLFLYGNDLENRIPTIEIIKMRGCEHMYTAVPYEIIDTGFNILLLNKSDRIAHESE